MCSDWVHFLLCCLVCCMSEVAILRHLLNWSWQYEIVNNAKRYRWNFLTEVSKFFVCWDWDFWDFSLAAIVLHELDKFVECTHQFSDHCNITKNSLVFICVRIYTRAKVRNMRLYTNSVQLRRTTSNLKGQPPPVGFLLRQITGLHFLSNLKSFKSSEPAHLIKPQRRCKSPNFLFCTTHGRTACCMPEVGLFSCRGFIPGTPASSCTDALNNWATKRSSYPPCPATQRNKEQWFWVLPTPDLRRISARNLEGNNNCCWESQMYKPSKTFCLFPPTQTPRLCPRDAWMIHSRVFSGLKNN